MGSFVWTLVPIESIGSSAVTAGILASTFTIPFALFAGYGGGVADRLGRNATFVVGFFVATAYTLLIGLQRSLIPKVAMAAMAGLGFAFAIPALMGETSQRGLDHQSQLGNVASLQRIFVNAGFIARPIIGGWLANFAGVQGAFYFLGLAMLICFVPIVIALIHFLIKGRLHRSIAVEFDL